MPLEKAFERAAKRICFNVERRKLQEVINCRLGTDGALGKSAEMEYLYRALSNVAGFKTPCNDYRRAWDRQGSRGEIYPL